MATDKSKSKLCELVETDKCCPVCGEKLKVGIVRLFGTETRVQVLCPCELERRQKERDAIDHRNTVRRLYEKSGISLRQQATTFDSWKKRPGTERACAACERYADRFMDEIAKKGTGLYLYGTTGSGKTHLVQAIANALIQQEVRVMFWNVPSLFGALKGAYDGRGNADEILHTAKTAQLLVLDDLGSEKPSEWTRETLYELLNYRVENMTPTIVTSNWEPSSPILADENALGSRMMSRLNDKTLFVPIIDKATDFRKERR